MRTEREDKVEIMENGHTELVQEIQDPVKRHFKKRMEKNRREETITQHIQKNFPRTKRQPSPDLKCSHMPCNK